MTLLPIRRADGPALIAANLAHRAFHAPWAEPFADAAGFNAWFARTVCGANAAFVARAGVELVGVVTLSEIVLGGFRSAYFGYYGYAPAAGRGLMTEAVRQTCARGFAEIGLHRIEANVQPGNARSLALIRRAGFAKEGFSPGYLRVGGAWRDHERWALVAGGP